MKYPHRIPILQANGELVRAGVFSQVVHPNAETSWKDVIVEQHHIPSNEWPDFMFKQHVIVLNVGRVMDCEIKKRGRFEQLLKPTGAISFFPSRQPFSMRIKMGGCQVADLIVLALDPEFVARTASKLGLQSDHVELIEQRRAYDSTLLHLALVLREGLRTGAAADPLHGEALSTAVSLHLLREYTAAKPVVKESHGKLSRRTMLRAVEYIQDQLGKELTVSRIAEEVSLSPFYFARQFKETTGKSPHQFVVEARVAKAKQLLETRNITISEAAYEVGFVDQSHLTRHFKRVFGLPPKVFLRNRG
jgi:AraC family transcriptional regulator